MRCRKSLRIGPADDRFAFSVERTDPKKVLFVDDGRRLDGQQFFRAALNATDDAAFQLEVLRPEVAATADLTKYAIREGIIAN